MRTTVIVTIAATLLNLLLVTVGVRWYVQSAIAEAISKNEKADADYWKSQLSPVYKSMGIPYNTDASTAREVFAPLIQQIASTGATSQPTIK